MIFKKNKSEKKTEPSLLRLKLWICPAIENILSTAAEEAWILKNFLTKFDKAGNLVSYVFQKSNAERSLFLAVWMYSLIMMSKLGVEDMISMYS